MSDLTLITHVYNAQAGVDFHIEQWKRYDPALLARLQFVIIDDFSTPPLTVDKGDLNLTLLRVKDDIDWNMPGCRNLAAMQATSPWLLFFDVDNVTSEENIAKMVGGLPRLKADTLYVFKRIHHGEEVDPHINTYLITRRGYFKAGGYDEDFAGHYGYEDVVFRNMWRKYVGTEVLLADIAFTQMGWRTNDLNRDTTRNHALAQYKAALGLPKPKGVLRFEWAEAE